MNLDFFVKIIVLYFLLLIFGCAKTIKVKVDTNTQIKYIEPQQCIMEKFEKKDFKIDIKTIDNKEYFIIDNDNLNYFLHNIMQYIDNVNNYKQCVILNEEYYKNVLKTLTKIN